MHWNYMIIKDQDIHYLAEVYWTRKKKKKIKNWKKMYAIICEWKNREDILKKIKTGKINYEYWKLDDEDFILIKKDLLFFRKILKIKK